MARNTIDVSEIPGKPPLLELALQDPANVRQLVQMVNEHAAALDALDGGGVPSLLDVNVVAYDADSTGATDSAAAVNAAIAAAADLSRVYFPPGTYRFDSAVALPATTSIHGTGATIRFASTARNAFEVAANADSVRVYGLTFVGDTDDDYNTNFGTAVYANDGVRDLDVISCTFSYCRPVQSTSQDSTIGRFYFGGNRVFNAPLGVSSSQYSIIVYNWFINDAVVDTRSQAVYLYGPTEGCILLGNFTKNISGPDFQIRAGAARNLQKRRFISACNIFENSLTYSMWFGSDDTTHFGSAVAVGNIFRNCVSLAAFQGCSDGLFATNQASWDYEYPHARTGTNSALVISHGSPSLGGHLSPCKDIRVEGNEFVHSQPFFGYITFTALPQAGDTVTIGAETYTWVTPFTTTPGEVQIQGTIASCIAELAAEVQGRGWGGKAQNVVLRDDTDCFYNSYTQSGAPNDRLYVASYATFALSTSTEGVRSTVTAPIDNRTACPIGVVGIATENLVVRGNTCRDFSSHGISLSNSANPTVDDNTMVGCSIFGDANAWSMYRRNRFIRTKTSDAAGLMPFRFLSVRDGFAVFKDNGLLQLQEYTTPELAGAQGIVTVSDGCSRAFLWYGSELYSGVNPSEPHSLPFRWADGDRVQFWDGGTTHTFTFKRSTPGTNEFSTADELITLINATGTIQARYASFVDIGGTTPEPNMMIEVRAVTPGAAGDGMAMWVYTRSKTCGQALRNPEDITVDAERTWFYGGSTPSSGTGIEGDPYKGTTKTVIFTPLASQMAPCVVQGFDSAAAALSPVAYAGSAVPGVCYIVTHGASVTATEQFVFSVASN